MLSPDELAKCIQQLRATLGSSIRLVDGLIAVAIGHESGSKIRDEKVRLYGVSAGIISTSLPFSSTVKDFA